jgi:hypothetical protein
MHSVCAFHGPREVAVRSLLLKLVMMKRPSFVPIFAFALGAAALFSACGADDSSGDVSCTDPAPDCRDSCNGDSEQAICNATYGWVCPHEEGSGFCPEAAAYDSGPSHDSSVDDSSVGDALSDDASDAD